MPAGITLVIPLSFARPVSLEMYPLPNFELVTLAPPVLLLIDPSPNFCVVVVDPSEERLIVPDPKRLVVTCWPLPRVMAPSPNLVVV